MSTDETKRPPQLPSMMGRMGLNRRALMARSAALGAGGALGVGIGRVGAQDATPGASPEASPAASPVASPVALAEPIRSVTREAYAQIFYETYPMTEPEQPGGQLIVGTSTDISTTNAILSADTYSNYIAGQVFETLVGGSVVDGTIVPGLADSYESLDGVTWTFNLNQTVTWHDGTPFTAEDVKFSFDSILAEDSQSAYAAGIQLNLNSYRVVDPYTFEIVANYPSASFLYDVPGTAFIMAKHLWEGIPPGEWAADPGSTGQDASRVIGTGPFMFQEWVPGDHTTLVPNPNYWELVAGRVPTLDEWIYRILPDDNAAVQALITGETDIIDTIPAPQTEDVINTEGLRVEVYPTFSFTYYIYNMNPARTPVFQDREVRQALLTALDKQGIVDTVYAGYGEVAVGTHSTLSIAYAPDQIRTRYDYSPERAMELLESAGWVDGGDGIRAKDGTPLAFTMILPEGSTADLLAAVFQENWNAIGADVQVEIVPFPTLLERLDVFDFDLSLLGFSWTPEPGQGAMFRCDSAAPNGFNYSSYCNPEYDRLDDLQARELDPEARLGQLIELSNIVNDDLPVGIFRFAEDRTGISDRVQNFYVNDFSFYWAFPYVWIRQD